MTMRLTYTFIFLPFLLPSIYAFDVLLNSADQCIGTDDGHFAKSRGPPSTPSECQNTYTKTSDQSIVGGNGGLFNARITPEGADIDTAVAFFGQAECKTLLAIGNVKSCLGLGHWASYQVLTLDEADDQLTNLDAEPVQELETNDTVTGKLGQGLIGMGGMISEAGASQTATEAPAASGSGSAPAARRKERKARDNAVQQKQSTGMEGREAKPEAVAHGALFEINGRQYRYHQLSERAWRGVPAEEWNDNLHKRNTNPLPYAQPSERKLKRRSFTSSTQHSSRFPQRAENSSPNPATQALRTRSILPSACNLIRTCMITSPSSSNLPIRDVGDDLLASIAAHSSNGADWTYLTDPFVVEIKNEGGDSQGFVYAQTNTHSDNIEQCVDPNDASQAQTGGGERDLLTSALIQGVDGIRVSDLRVDLKVNAVGVNGPTNSLFVSTRSRGEGDARIRPVCVIIEVFY